MAFFFIRNFFTNAQSVKCLLSTLFALGVYLCLTAIMERYDVSALIFPAYITDKTILLHLDRSRGPLLNAAFNGLAITVCFVAGLFLLPLVSPVRRLLLLILLPLFGVGVFFTATRSAYLVFLLALSTLVFFYRSKTPIWKLTPLLLTLCLIGVLANSERLFSDKREAGGIAQLAEVNIRFQLIAKSLRLIQENPILGVGLAHFSVADAPGVFQDNQHNHLIGMAAELGIIGLAVYLGLLATIFRRLYALADNPRVSSNAWANAVILLTLGVTVCLVNNIFVEASLCPFINISTFSFAGLAALFTDRPDILDATL
ncbi:O-antigen ligase family protein [Solidesulfovibrio sp.]